MGPAYILMFKTIYDILHIFRYTHKGSPLHIEDKQHVTPAVCCYCGSQRVFELQLMPALVNFLRYSPETGK